MFRAQQNHFDDAVGMFWPASYRGAGQVGIAESLIWFLLFVQPKRQTRI